VNRSRVLSLAVLLAAHRAIAGTCVSRSVSGACAIERCSPQSVPFPPRPPRKAALPCSAGSRVQRHSPTSPVRSRPPFGLWPSRTGLVRLSKTCRRSPGSCACCFSACAGSQTTQDRIIHSRLAWLSCCLPPPIARRTDTLSTLQAIQELSPPWQLIEPAPIL